MDAPPAGKIGPLTRILTGPAGAHHGPRTTDQGQPMRRTHTCGELREAHIGQTVILNGWVNTFRAYPDQVFVDLRDRYGITQVVFEAERSAELFAVAGELRSEFVLAV